MFEYVLSKQYDYDIFKKYCTIFDAIPGINKLPTLHDVDMGIYQRYSIGGRNLTVKLSASEDLTFIVSEMDISAFLPS